MAKNSKKHQNIFFFIFSKFFQMSSHSNYAKRTCAFCCDAIPCVQDRKQSKVPQPGKFRKIDPKTCSKTVERILKTDVYSKDYLSYLLEQDDLPKIICSTCWNLVVRNPEKLPKTLRMVEWHKTPKSRKYHDHLKIDDLRTLEAVDHCCPFICENHLRKHQVLIKGAPTEDQISKILENQATKQTIAELTSKLEKNKSS